MSPVNFDHGRIVLRIGFLLSRHLEQHPVGVVGAEIGFKLAADPDTVQRTRHRLRTEASACRRRQADAGSSRARLTWLSRCCRQTIARAR